MMPPPPHDEHDIWADEPSDDRGGMFVAAFAFMAFLGGLVGLALGFCFWGLGE